MRIFCYGLIPFFQIFTFDAHHIFAHLYEVQEIINHMSVA